MCWRLFIQSLDLSVCWISLIALSNNPSIWTKQDSFSFLKCHKTNQKAQNCQGTVFARHTLFFLCLLSNTDKVLSHTEDSNNVESRGTHRRDIKPSLIPVNCLTSPASLAPYGGWFCRSESPRLTFLFLASPAHAFNSVVSLVVANDTPIGVCPHSWQPLHQCQSGEGGRVLYTHYQGEWRDPSQWRTFCSTLDSASCCCSAMWREDTHP